MWSFCIWAQPMRDDVTLAEPMPIMIPEHGQFSDLYQTSIIVDLDAIMQYRVPFECIIMGPDARGVTDGVFFNLNSNLETMHDTSIRWPNFRSS